MTIQESIPFLSLPVTSTWELLAAALLLSTTYASYVVLTSQRPYPNIPLVGGEGGVSASKTRFARDAKSVLQRAWEQVRDLFYYRQERRDGS